MQSRASTRTSTHRVERLGEFRNEHRLLAIRPGGNDGDSSPGFLLDEFQVTLRFIWQLLITVDAERACPPAGQLCINRFDVLVAGSLRGNFLRFLAVNPI